MKTLRVPLEELEAIFGVGLNDTTARWGTLGPREKEVCLMVANNLRNGEIASLLGVTGNAIGRYTFMAAEKLGVQTRVGITNAVNLLRIAGEA